MVLKESIIQDDEKIINCILYGLLKFNKKDKTINLTSLKFSIDSYEKLNTPTLSKLSTTATNLFHLINEFGKLHNVKEEVTIYLVDDQLQDTETDTCGIFHYFNHYKLVK